jgi:hypothetical protein
VEMFMTDILQPTHLLSILAIAVGADAAFRS